jgi:hypothetical protein
MVSSSADEKDVLKLKALAHCQVIGKADIKPNIMEVILEILEFIFTSF